MLQILKAYGIPPNLFQAIEKMYTNTKAKVISPDGETDMFQITAGVLQGDTLAPFLSQGGLASARSLGWSMH